MILFSIIIIIRVTFLTLLEHGHIIFDKLSLRYFPGWLLFSMQFGLYDLLILIFLTTNGCQPD